jgi:hypothetical protein
MNMLSIAEEKNLLLEKRLKALSSKIQEADINKQL